MEILYLLEAHIPAFPETGHEFLIFRWGGGYASKPGGPRVAFIHREKDEFVTEMEIAKTLRILDISEDKFWTHADACMIDPSGQSGTSEKTTPK